MDAEKEAVVPMDRLSLILSVSNDLSKVIEHVLEREADAYARHKDDMDDSIDYPEHIYERASRLQAVLFSEPVVLMNADTLDDETVAVLEEVYARNTK